MLLAAQNPGIFRGSEVVDKAGKTLGRVKGFVTDPQSDRAWFAIVESEGRSDADPRAFLVPWDLFLGVREDMRDGGVTRLVLDASLNQLQGGVEYDPNKRISADEVYAYWNRRWGDW